jgi:hypothetical protein
LPRPNSAELHAVVKGEEERLVYGLLYDRRHSPPSNDEIREFASDHYGEPRTWADRRARNLRAHFVIRTVNLGGNRYGYQLLGWRKDAHPSAGRTSIPKRLEVLVLEDWGARCALCGRAPKEDKVKLVLDHIVPVHWGGLTVRTNLRPLCEEHNHARQAWIKEMEPHAHALRQAIALTTVWERIGTLLKALEGQWVSVDLIQAVAREENRGDPTRRLRDLRVALGWTYTWKRRKVGKRTETLYRLDSWKPWPQGGPAKAIAEYEARRRRRRNERP